MFWNVVWKPNRRGRAQLYESDLSWKNRHIEMLKHRSVLPDE